MVLGGAGATPTADLAARVHASVVDHLTDLVAAAVSILLALDLGAAEGSVGVAHVLLCTLALRPVVHHQAFSVGSAPCPVTGVDTLSVAASISCTCEVRPTVSIGSALTWILTSSIVWVTNQSSRTRTFE